MKKTEFTPMVQIPTGRFQSGSIPTHLGQRTEQIRPESNNDYILREQLHNLQPQHSKRSVTQQECDVDALMEF